MSDIRPQLRGDLKYIAVNTICVGSGADERTLSPGEPLPSLPSADLGRLQALGAIELAGPTAEGSSGPRFEYFADPRTQPDED